MTIVKYKTKTGVRYFPRVKGVDGRWLPSEAFATRAEADVEHAALLASRNNTAAAQFLHPTLSFQEFWTLWFAECRGHVTQGWSSTVTQMGIKYILPILGTRLLSDISPRDIGRVMESARATGIMPGTLRHIYNTLHKAFDDACEHFEFIEFSPVKSRYRPKLTKRQRNYLSPSQSVQLLAAASGHWMEPVVNLGLFLGLRPCEIQALTWDAVDLENAEVLIKAAYRRKEKRIVDCPKQGDWGRATIPHQLVQYLTQIGAGMRRTDFVVQNRLGTGMLDYGVMRTVLFGLCATAGVPRITPHEMRHSCTELWVYQGASKEDCGRQLNHSSSSVTDTYMHRNDDRLRMWGKGFRLPESPRSIVGLRLVP